jgi:hypothetical protein
VNVATRVFESYETDPETGDPPAVSVKLEVLIVDEFIASLKPIAIVEDVATPVAPGEGFLDTIVGGVLSVGATVVNEKM